MSSNNSISKFKGASVDDLQLALGITRFESEDDWNQSIGGLIVQGGKTPIIGVDAELVVTFSMAFPKQVLGIFPSELYSGTLIGAFGGVFIKEDYTLSSFTIRNDNVAKRYFWFAVGI